MKTVPHRKVSLISSHTGDARSPPRLSQGRMRRPDVDFRISYVRAAQRTAPTGMFVGHPPQGQSLTAPSPPSLRGVAERKRGRGECPDGFASQHIPGGTPPVSFADSPLMEGAGDAAVNGDFSVGAVIDRPTTFGKGRKNAPGGTSGGRKCSITGKADRSR